VVDEAAFVDDLEYLVKDILLPQTLETDGTLLISSTPPKTPAHEYVALALDAEARGHYVRKTIFDTDYPREQIDEYIKSSGGLNSTTFRREYMAEFVVDEALAIVPEWKNEYVQDIPRTEAFHLWHKYVGLDIGVRDFSVLLYGYYDFTYARLVIEDEVILNGHKVTSEGLATADRDKVFALGYNPVYLRVSDNNNLALLQDLSAKHNLPFMATSKDSLVAMVNNLRVWVDGGRVIVHPRCKNLAGALKNGIWRNIKAIGRDFARTQEYGHFDALAALIYLVRNVNQHSNPLPHGYGVPAEVMRFRPNRGSDSDTAAILRDTFGLKKR